MTVQRTALISHIPQPKSKTHKAAEVELAKRSVEHRKQQLQRAYRALARAERDHGDYQSYVSRITKQRNLAIKRINRMAYAVQVQDLRELQRAKEFCRTNFKRSMWMLTDVYHLDQNYMIYMPKGYNLFLFESNDDAIIFKLKFG
jgi:hypothetical protein